MLLIPKKWLTYLLGLSVFVLFLLILIASYVNYTSRPVVITLDENGFQPEKIRIEKGQSVRFVTSLDEPFWPASDSHPTHTKYPEFEPGRALEPKESWEFTFDTPGVWTFHDHLKSQFSGKIIVLGNPGESVENCIKNSEKTLKAECWEGEFADILEKDGVDAAFDTFVDIYNENSLFRRNCHDVMHYVGDSMYAMYQNSSETTIRPETTYCGYGFYHGFIQAALYEEGVGAFDEAQQYCNSLYTDEHTGADKATRSRAQSACYHGIGHAVFDSIEGKYWGNQTLMVQQGLTTCGEVFSDEQAVSSCASGVFNSLAIAITNEYYDLSFDDTDPMLVCRQQKESDRPLCFMEVGIHYIRYKKYTFDEFLSFVETLRSFGATNSVIIAYTDDSIRGSEEVPNLESLRNICLSLKTEDDLLACVDGTLRGLRDSIISKPDFLVAHQKFCSYFPEKDAVKEICNLSK